MTLLNLTNDGFTNILVNLCRFLCSQKSVGESFSKDEILEYMSVDSNQHLANTLNKWLKLGLFAIEKKTNRLFFSDKYSENLKNYFLRKDGELSEKKLGKVLRELVFMPANNKNLGEDKCVAADLTYSLSFLNLQNVYTIEMTWDHIDQLQNQQFIDPAKRPMNNSTRINGLKNWGTLLGFFKDGISFEIDPSEAIDSELNEVFGKNKELDARTFLGNLANRLPVLDGGIYRQRLLKDLQKQALPDAPENHLSTSFSRGLYFLWKSRRIELIEKSDAPVWFIMGRESKPLHKFSHVKLLGETEE